MSRQWVNEAIIKLKANSQRSSDTHLLKIEFPDIHGVDLYFKDESTHFTGSLKHRLARSLFLFALVNGEINENTIIVEASSGNTAVSEAYFAQILGLRFVAVMAKNTSISKIKNIKKYDGECIFVDNPCDDRATAKKIANETKGYFMDQFTYAERATDWRGNNNIAESIFTQMKSERYNIPSWIVCGAGTGGTSTTIGRYIKYKGHDTQLCVVDPVLSVLYDHYKTGDFDLISNTGSNIEGIGRPYVPVSFNRKVIDRMLKIKNEQSYAAMRFLNNILGKKIGASSGTNLYGALILMHEMYKNNQSGSIVTVLCDSGNLYDDTYNNDDWLKKNNYNLDLETQKINNFYKTAQW